MHKPTDTYPYLAFSYLTLKKIKRFFQTERADVFMFAY